MDGIELGDGFFETGINNAAQTQTPDFIGNDMMPYGHHESFQLSLQIRFLITRQHMLTANVGLAMVLW